jgi:hypothetical protein
MLIVSLITFTSAPNPMPTAWFSPKPVPLTVTETPGVWDVGVNVITPAAFAIGIHAKTIENTRKAIIDVA